MRQLFLLGVFLVSVGSADWQEDLDSLLLLPPGADRDTILEEVVAASPDWREVVRRLESLRFSDREKRIVLRMRVCDDGVERPWVLYVPTGYDPRSPTPLLVILHGGVSRPTLIENPAAWADSNAFTALAEEQSWFVLYPLGQEGATWWDKVGMENIRSLIRTVKKEYNVDDDRVWMGGFSDGGSAAFVFAMVAPTDFAAFVALNGHLGVGSLDGDLPTYATNFFNTPVYAVTTDRDRLYPSQKMRALVDMAQHAGGSIFYREQEGEHDLTYADEELPLIVRFLERHPRDPFPIRIVWETSESRFGICRWFAIDRVTTEKPAAWHVDHNLALVDDRVIIGFFPDDSFEGPGVKAGKVLEGTAAENLRMERGDVIVRAGGQEIKTIEDLDLFKAGLNRGDPIELTVMRGGGEIMLTGRLPEPQNYYVFKREQPSGLARVAFSANRVNVETSRVGAFRILVHPDMIRLEENLVVQVNGDVVFDELVEPALEFLLRNFLENRDRRLIYLAEVKIAL